MLVGDVLEIEDVGTGWPALAVLKLDGDTIPLALFVSPIGASHRGRDMIERRFQNPSNMTLESVPGRHSVLLGVWAKDDAVDVERTVVAMAEAGRRDDGRHTRWSVFLELESLVGAMTSGWSIDVTDSGETIYYVRPSLLPIAIMVAAGGEEPTEEGIRRTVFESDWNDLPEEVAAVQARSRVRRAVNMLVRDSRFRGGVLDAYEGQCAMCGIGLGLVQGAHIYPASAPGSVDTTSNGLALCANHHLAFDRHLLAVMPDTLEVSFHPSVLMSADLDAAVASFVYGTISPLRSALPGFEPDPQAFASRYSYYSDKYAWLDW